MIFWEFETMFSKKSSIYKTFYVRDEIIMNTFAFFWNICIIMIIKHKLILIDDLSTWKKSIQKCKSFLTRIRFGRS